MLLSSIQKNYSFLSAETPTYWPTDPNKLPNLLDFFITSKISPSNTDIQPSYDLSSDHTPVISTISTTIIKRKPKPRLHNAHTNWQTYKTEICNRVNCDWKLKSCEDLEIATTRFTHILQKAAVLATPERKPYVPINNIPSTIKRLVALKRKAEATWQKTHAPDDRRIFNNASNKLKTALHKMRNDNFTEYVSTLKCSDHSIWKPLKSRKKPTMPNPPIRKNSNLPGPWAKSDEEKAELFARHLSEVFTPHDNTFDPDVENKLTNLNKHQKLPAFTIMEINQVIKRLFPHKAPGPDNTTAQMLQELPTPGLKVLLYILNAILRLEYWPTTFKLAKIIMVLKPAKPPTMLPPTGQSASFQ